MKPLIDIWSNSLNNEKAFQKPKKKSELNNDDVICLTPQQQFDFYEILARDKVIFYDVNDLYLFYRIKY